MRGIVGRLAILAIVAGVLWTSPGCTSAKAGVVTEADRVNVAAELAYASMESGGGVIWQPIDDRPANPPAPVPIPAPSPVPSRSVPTSFVKPTNAETLMSIDGGGGHVVEVSMRGECADGVCDPGGASYGDDAPRRPILNGARVVGRGVGAFFRNVRPIRRIGGFLFRRRC